MPRDAHKGDARRSLLREHAVALAAVLLAFAARWSLDPELGDRLPFQFFYLSTVIAGWYGGLGPGVISVLLGFLLADWFFISPRQALGVTGVADLTQVVAYFVVGLAITAFGHFVSAKQNRLRTAQLAHEQAHKRMVVILESITDCFYSLDRDWRYSYIN